MLASRLPTSFLDAYSLSMSSLGSNALFMVISFLVLWSICLSSSLVYLRKGPEYLMRDTAEVFIRLIRFLLESFVSSSFEVLLIYSFWISTYYYHYYYHSIIWTFHISVSRLLSLPSLLLSSSLLLLLLLFPLRVFRHNISWQAFNGVWAFASLLWSPELLWVVRPISAIYQPI